MKGVIIGDWKWRIYEKALHDGFINCGHKVDSLQINNNFKNNTDKIQYKLRSGPLINNINRQITNKVLSNDYDFIFFQRPIIIKKSTLENIKESSHSKLICYHNDNPFQQKYNALKYRRYFNILSLCDIVYVYRPSNIVHAKKYGANNVKILPPFYVKGLHDIEHKIQKTNDVVFIGHFENDGRDKMINYLIKNDINVKVFGGKWEKSLVPKKHRYPTLYDNLYVKELQRSKISLAFFSKINKDVYTRRSFEIPATKTFMLSEYSSEIVKLFKPGYEFDFFRSREELYQKVNFYLKNDKLRKQMVKRAFKRNFERNNNVIAESIIKDLEKLK